MHYVIIKNINGNYKSILKTISKCLKRLKCIQVRKSTSFVLLQDIRSLSTSTLLSKQILRNSGNNDGKGVKDRDNQCCFDPRCHIKSIYRIWHIQSRVKGLGNSGVNSQSRPISAHHSATGFFSMSLTVWITIRLAVQVTSTAFQN